MLYAVFFVFRLVTTLLTEVNTGELKTLTPTPWTNPRTSLSLLGAKKTYSYTRSLKTQTTRNYTLYWAVELSSRKYNQHTKEYVSYSVLRIYTHICGVKNRNFKIRAIIKRKTALSRKITNFLWYATQPATYLFQPINSIQPFFAFLTLGDVKKGPFEQKTLWTNS